MKTNVPFVACAQAALSALAALALAACSTLPSGGDKAVSAMETACSPRQSRTIS